MAGYLYSLMRPKAETVKSMIFSVNDAGQCLITEMDDDGKPCDFQAFDDVEAMADQLLTDEAGEGGYSRAEAYKATGALCYRLLDVKKWQEVADILNGEDGKDKWQMYGKWCCLGPWQYIDRAGAKSKFEVTELGKNLDAMADELAEDDE